MEQKSYSARIRLYYRINGELDFIDATLDGIGIESCVQINDADFSVRYTTPGASKSTRRIKVRSTGTRPVTIASLFSGGPDAARFTGIQLLAPQTTLPLTLAPREVQEVEITFAPDTDTQSLWQASLNVEGDFAYVDCPNSCSDLSAILTGRFGTSSVNERVDLSGYGITGVTPNPFSGSTEISFNLGKAGETTVEVYDASGRKIALLVSERLAEGEHALEWDGEGETAGVYYVRVTSGEWSLSRSIHLVR